MEELVAAKEKLVAQAAGTTQAAKAKNELAAAKEQLAAAKEELVVQTAKEELAAAKQQISQLRGLLPQSYCQPHKVDRHPFDAHPMQLGVALFEGLLADTLHVVFWHAIAWSPKGSWKKPDLIETVRSMTSNGTRRSHLNNPFQ